MKPKIGITCSYIGPQPTPLASGVGLRGQDWQACSNDFTVAVQRAGGIPLLLPVINEPELMFDAIDSLDGLILIGGNDINPLLYGAKYEKQCGSVCPMRDAFDITLTRYMAEHSDKPFIGICRGSQVINVALGGTLYQELENVPGLEHHTIINIDRNYATQKLKVKPDSLLEKIFGAREVMINSFHHQGIRDLAPPLEAIGWADDGMVEATCLPGKPFFLGMQWHPEMMADNELQQKIFRAFVEAAKN